MKSIFDLFREGFSEHETQEFETVKGEYKTVIKVIFDKTGYPIYMSSDTHKIVDEKQLAKRKLKAQLAEAIRDENYEQAAKIRDDIRAI